MHTFFTTVSTVAQAWIWWLLIINLFTFFLFGLDKWKARRHAWRIPERTLLISALLGGSIGALLGMLLFRHKTKHPQFTIGIPVILLVQIAGILWFFLQKI